VGLLVNGWTSGEIFGVMVVDAGHYLRTNVLLYYHAGSGDISLGQSIDTPIKYP